MSLVQRLQGSAWASYLGAWGGLCSLCWDLQAKGWESLSGLIQLPMVFPLMGTASPGRYGAKGRDRG